MISETSLNVEEYSGVGVSVGESKVSICMFN
jgi:hypothetical protein